MCLALGEDAVGLRHHEESGELKSPGEIVKANDEIAPPLGSGEVLVEALAGGVEELGMVGFVRAEFRESRKGRGLQVIGWDACGGGVAGEENRSIVRLLERGEVVGVVLEGEE